MTPELQRKYDGMRGASHIYHNSGVTLQSISPLISAALKNQASPFDLNANLISVILLYAISSEVGIKALLAKEGKLDVHSHDLKSLFEKLDEPLQIEIKNKVENDDFDNELEKIKKSFVDWRYFYEGGNMNINLSFLRKFSEVINGFILA